MINNTSKNLELFSLLILSTVLTTTLAFNIANPHLFRLHPSPLIAAQEKFNGEMPINKDDYGFFTQVWLTNETKPLTTEPFIPTKMMIGLAQSGTFLSGECFMFKPYDCAEVNCTHDEKQVPRSVHYPYFSSQLTNAKQTVTVNNGTWTLHTHADIGNSCTPEDLTMFGLGRAGVVNLGTALEVTNHEIFSIYLAKNLTGGKILFRKEPSLIEASAPNYTLKSSTNWRVTVSTGVVQVGGVKNVSFSGDIFFDVHADAIGLPSAIYDQVFAALKETANIACKLEDDIRQNCTGSLEKMPTIVLQINDVAVPIPPQIYTRAGATNNTFILRLRSLSPTAEGINHINTAFEHSIVLDQNFMSHYYTVFEDVNKVHTVTIYQAKPPKEEAAAPGGFNKNIIFVAGGVVLLIVIVYFVQLQMRKKKLHNALLEEDATQKLIKDI